MEKYAAIILGAGKGTRINEGEASPIPKVMFEAAGKPVIHYSVQTIRKAGVKTVVVVVGYKKELVTDYLGDHVEYAIQEEQLGTGHAAACARNTTEGKAENLIIFYGDNPLFKAESIQGLIAAYEREKPIGAMLTVEFADPEFWAFGRIVRDPNGNIKGIVEQKDCTPEQLKIKESNSGFYIFDAQWFWENCDRLSNDNKQGEYYLTDMIGIAIDQGHKVIAMLLSEESEALGINTLEQLQQAEKVLLSRCPASD